MSHLKIISKFIYHIIVILFREGREGSDYWKTSQKFVVDHLRETLKFDQFSQVAFKRNLLAGLGSLTKLTSAVRLTEAYPFSRAAI